MRAEKTMKHENEMPFQKQVIDGMYIHKDSHETIEHTERLPILNS